MNGRLIRRWAPAASLAVALTMLAACGQAARQATNPGSAADSPTSQGDQPQPPALTASPLPPPPSTSPAQRVQPAIPQQLAAIVLRQLQAPGHDYTIAVPDGWDFQRSQSGAPPTYSENPIIVAPAGQAAPSAFIWGLLPITDFAEKGCEPDASTVLSDPAYLQKLMQCWGSSMAQKWSPQETVPIMGKVLMYLAPGSQFEVLQQGPTQADGHAEAIVRWTTSSGSSEMKWGIRMVYALDASYTAIGAYRTGAITPLYHSFAFISGCGAAPSQLESSLRTCAAILTSFHPTTWLSREIHQYLASQQQQVTQTKGTLDQIKEQEYQQSLSRSAADMHVYQMWWNALGHTVDLTDGRGTVYNTESGYDRYCAFVDNHLLGLNNPLTLPPTGCNLLTPMNAPPQ